MFAVAPLEAAAVCLSFKASRENFAELTERANIIPAPYLARAQWVALETREAVGREELARLLRESYDLTAAKLPKKISERLGKPAARRTAVRKNTGTKKAAAKKGQRRR